MNNIEYLEKYKGIDIFMKRDDKLPFSFGGNKVRITYELFKDIEEGGYTSVISYGSPSSNMNRAIAEMSKSKGISCYVIIKLDDVHDPDKEPGSKKNADGTDCEKKLCCAAYSEGNAVVRDCADRDPENHAEHAAEHEAKYLLRKPETVNEHIVQESGAEIVYCTDGHVKECVESVMKLSRSRGEKPYYIYGGSDGSGNEVSLMRASYAEYGEIEEYERECGIFFDAIVLTAGTGATISGLAAAVNEAVSAGKRPKGTRLIGFSAARSSERELEVIRKNLDIFGACRNTQYGYMPEIIDRYLCGGYGCFDNEIKNVIAAYEAKKVPLDPTYTGKSFRGLLEEAELGNISGRVLFIHTGGYPVYLDYRAKSGEGEVLPAPSAFT